MAQMTARFPGKCATSGAPIRRGDTIDYDPVTKRTVLVKSQPVLVRARSTTMERYRKTDYAIAHRPWNEQVA